MGQGQSEVAMKLLSDCSKNGDWLCLKNLHLVTNWLPNLEKVLLLFLDILIENECYSPGSLF